MNNYSRAHRGALTKITCYIDTAVNAATIMPTEKGCRELEQLMERMEIKQTSAETCLDFYDRCTNSIHKAHKEDLSQLVNQPEARDRYQRAIKQTVRQHFVAGLHSDIKAQISAKLQSLDTKEKLLTAAAEIEAAVRPKNAACLLYTSPSPRD